MSRHLATHCAIKRLRHILAERQAEVEAERDSVTLGIVDSEHCSMPWWKG